MPPELRTIVVPGELAGERVDRLVSMLGEVPRSVARSLIDAGDVTIVGAAVRPSLRVGEGTEITFPVAEAVDTVTADASVSVEVLFEDDHMVVVNKPAGLVVHRGAGHEAGTLVNGLVARYPAIVGVGVHPRWGIVHRLDRDTSGAMLVALTNQSHDRLSAQIKAREVHRHYTALVSGAFGTERGTVDAPIGRDPKSGIKMAMVIDGKYARTHYRRVREWEDVSLIDLELETGRTHQIRVHMAGIGHSVIGDRLYRPGPDPVQVPRMFLHAHRLVLDHPITGARMDIEAPLPADLGRVLSELDA